jgi:Spy/CpxP family protein refolding chaperone
METAKNIVWQVWALIGVVFVLGCLTGASVTSLYRSRQGGPPMSGAEGRGGGRRFMLEKMRRELNLTDEQAAQAQAVMDDSRKDFRGAFDSCPQLKDARDKGAARIRVLLTPEQQQKFDEIRARRQAERAQDDSK